MKRNKAILSIILIVVILLIAGASIYISSKVSERQAIAPTAPVSEPAACEDECPRSDGALVNCTGAADGTNISLCNAAGRVEICGGKSYTCPTPGGAWTLTPTSTEPDWVGSEACTVTGVATTIACVPSGVVTCTPDCPTACGKPASTISSCKDSCGVATTKACAATAVCGDITITKKAFKNESTNTAGVYDLKTEINSVNQGQTFVYAIYLKNTTSVAVTKGVYIKDSLEKKNHLTFVDTNTSICRYVQNTDTMETVICDEIKLNPGQEKVFAFRVKVNDSAVIDQKIENRADVWFLLDKSKNAIKSLTVCSNACGKVATDTCPATPACTDDLEVTKKAYKYVGGSYAYTTEIDTVAKNQTFIYAITIENTGDVDATGITITDTLNGDKQDQLTFVDAKSGCTYSASERKVTCNGVTVKAGEEKVYAFKVKVASGAVNGDIVKNVAVVNAAGTNISAANELTISTVVGCNHTCTGDSECASGLVCDTSSNKCRREACTTEDTCSCPVPRAEVTARPTLIRTPAPTRIIDDAPSIEEPTLAETKPTTLPETGILDFPGVAAFGGGLLLAIVGILLAL